MTYEEAKEWVDIARMSYVCDPNECGFKKGKEACLSFHCDDIHDVLAMAIEALEKIDAVDVLLHFFPDVPCNYNGMDDKTDEWCAEHCGEQTVRACWEHAIKERWYE